jgi:hypothetical protein
MNANTVRKLFFSAAIFNALAGLPILLAGRQVSTLFGMPQPPNLLFSQIAGAAVLLFGVGYWLESRSPGEHRSVVALGLAGKLMIFALAVGHVVAGTPMNWVFPALATVDLAYA